MLPKGISMLNLLTSAIEEEISAHSGTNTVVLILLQAMESIQSLDFDGARETLRSIRGLLNNPVLIDFIDYGMHGWEVD